MGRVPSGIGIGVHFLGQRPDCRFAAPVAGQVVSRQVYNSSGGNVRIACPWLAQATVQHVVKRWHVRATQYAAAGAQGQSPRARSASLDKRAMDNGCNANQGSRDVVSLQDLVCRARVIQFPFAMRRHLVHPRGFVDQGRGRVATARDQ